MADAELKAVGRRTLLLGAVAGAAGIVGAPIVDLVRPRPALAETPDWRGLARGLDGTLIRPSSDAYAGAKKTFDPRRDGLKPAAIVRVESTSDIAESLAFAQRYRLAVRARSGGHSYVGASTGNGVLVVATQAAEEDRIRRQDPSGPDHGRRPTR